jgi:hypothetical protein
VSALAVSGSTIYVGGSFTSIGGQPRNRVAALDAASALATAWDPNADGDVLTVLPTPTSVYVGGVFTNLGGLPRNYVGAVDVASGLATPWNPDARAANDAAPVHTLISSGSTVYVGGGFRSMGVEPNGQIAAVLDDSPTPVQLALKSVNAQPDRVEVTWLDASFGTQGAAVERRVANEAWQAVAEVRMDSRGQLVYEDTAVSPGIEYGYRLRVQRGGLEAWVGEVWVRVPAARELALAGVLANLGSGSLRVSFTLPEAAPARLELFDLAGRRIAEREVGELGQGTHVVTIDPRVDAPGVTFLRLSQGSRSLTARAVILR